MNHDHATHVRRRPRRTTRRTAATVAALAAVVGGVGMLSTVLLAQWRVNNQIYGSSSPSIKYGPQVNGSVYTPASTSRAMPSELRNAYYKSGDLPSTIRMNAAAIGPLAPSGPMAYIDGPPKPKKSITGGNYVDTSVGQRGATIKTGPSGSGSVRYAGLPTNQFATGATVKTPGAVPTKGSGGGAGPAVAMNDIDWASVVPTGGSIRHADAELVMPKYLPAPADSVLRNPASTAPAPRG